MREKDPEIAVAIRTFGNNKQNEGIRVKPGMRFAVGKPQPGMRMISVQRYRELAAKQLLRPLGGADTKAAPAANPEPAAEAEKGGAHVKPITHASIARPSATRAAARKRASQEKDPPPPERLNPPAQTQTEGQAGSQNGTEPPASSSPGGQASNTSQTRSPRRRGQTRT